MNYTPKQLLDVMLDDMDDGNIKILCHVIGNLVSDERITLETLTKAFNSENENPFLDFDK